MSLIAGERPSARADAAAVRDKAVMDVRPRAHPVTLAIATTLILLAVAVPPAAVASVFVAPEATRYAAVVLGVWCFKGLLALHAGILVFAGRPGVPALEPLVRLAAPLPRPAWHLPALFSIVVVAAIVRVVHLGDGLWIDEIWTLICYVRLPSTEIVTRFASQNQHIFFSLVARWSVLLFGDSAWAIRAPAVLFGVLSLPALYWFGSLIASRREALFATAIMAVSYHHVWFSQNARGYTGLLLLTLLGTGLFLKLVSRSGAGTWPLVLGYAASMAAAAYTHLTAVLVVIGHAVVLAALLVKRRDARPWVAARPAILALLLAGTFSLQLYALVLPQVMNVLLPSASQAAVAPGWEWLDPLWMATEALRVLRRGLPGGWVALAAAILITVAGMVRLCRRSMVTAALIFAPVLLTAAALLATGHNLWPRFFFFAAGFGILIVTIGVQGVASALAPRRAPAVSSALLGLVLLLSAATVPRAWGPKQDFEGAAAFIEASRGPTDAVVALSLARSPYERYLGMDWLWVPNAAALERVEAEHARTWAVYASRPYLQAQQPDVWQRLQSAYRVVGRFPGTLGDGTIYILVKE